MLKLTDGDMFTLNDGGFYEVDEIRGDYLYYSELYINKNNEVYYKKPRGYGCRDTIEAKAIII